MSLCVPAHVHACVCVLRIFPQRLEEGVRSPKARDIGGCEPSNLGAENQTRIVWKSGKWSESPRQSLQPQELLSTLFAWEWQVSGPRKLISSLLFSSLSCTWGLTLKPFPRWLCQGVGQVQNIPRWGPFLFRSLWNPQVGATASHPWQCFRVPVKPSLGVTPYYQSYGSY